MDNKCTEIKQKYIFVELLKNYKCVLEQNRSTNNVKRFRNKAALNALTKKFNEKCHTKLSTAQIKKKMNNFKFRLRKKNFESLSGNKKPRFTALEVKFLSLWDDSGIEFSKNSSSGRTDITDTSNQPGYIQYPDVQIGLEDVNVPFKEDPSSHKTAPQSTMKNWDYLASDSESESSFKDVNDNNDPYASMTMDELQRAVLISQSKMLRAEEASARAKEKLKLFELSVLQRNNRNGMSNFFF